MSTNTYLAEEHIYYDDEASVYYGYHISWSGESQSVYPFCEREERDLFERCVAATCNLYEADSNDFKLLCALQAMALFGDDYQQESGAMELEDRYGEDSECPQPLEEISIGAGYILAENRRWEWDRYNKVEVDNG